MNRLDAPPAPAPPSGDWLPLDSLSILLPVYCWPIGPLLTALHAQAVAEPGLAFEILAYDDASPDPDLCAANRAAAATLPHVRYHNLPHNVGRAAIRNLLAAAAAHSWLLFLDADSGLPDAQFLARYRRAVAATAPPKPTSQPAAKPAPPRAFIGGTAYTATPPADPALRLRWTYGRAREQRLAAERQRAPYAAFTLNNLLIRAETYTHFGLDEGLGRTYGHEDTAFGGALATAGIPLAHLDNPVLHLGLEPAPLFRQKTAEAVGNLVRLARAGQAGATVSGLWRLAQQLRRAGLAGAARRLLTGAEPQLLRNLDSATPSVRAFDAWRLLLVLRELPLSR